jgi:uncharacterized protein (UPF0333 family)
MRSLRFLTQKGQTSVEYILLLMAIVAIMSSVMKIVKDRFLGTGECNAASTSVICKFETAFDFEKSQFRYYTIKRRTN